MLVHAESLKFELSDLAGMWISHHSPIPNSSSQPSSSASHLVLARFSSIVANHSMLVFMSTQLCKVFHESTPTISHKLEQGLRNNLGKRRPHARPCHLHTFSSPPLFRFTSMILDNKCFHFPSRSPSQSTSHVSRLLLGAVVPGLTVFVL